MDAPFTALVSIALGIGLAAASGFRIFVPLLFAGIAARAGWLPLNESFAWLQSTPALVVLGNLLADVLYAVVDPRIRAD